MPGVIIDLMPINEEILGFSNSWYKDGFQTAIDYKIDDLNTVKILSPPYFLASKLEAFRNRGNNDGRTSTDFEDFVYVLENRSSIWDEMKDADTKVRYFLRDQFHEFNNNKHIEEWIGAHSGNAAYSSVYNISEEMKKFVELV